jgi:hypothetical protein
LWYAFVYLHETVELAKIQKLVVAAAAAFVNSKSLPHVQQIYDAIGCLPQQVPQPYRKCWNQVLPQWGWAQQVPQP